VGRRLRWISRGVGTLLRLVLLSLVATAAVALWQAWVPIGKGPSGARLVRMEASKQWDGDGFENPEPLWNDGLGMITEALDASEHVAPDAPVPVAEVDPSRFATPPPSGLRVTWLGHSTMLVEIDGRRFLTDPVWSDRISPVPWVGPTRWYPNPLPLDRMPELDAVILSHDHYDHLDYPTIAAMKDADTTFVVPLGVGSHLAYWGVPVARIVELDWWERHRIGDVELVCTPARHASGRQLFDQNDTLWAGWAFVGPRHRAWFSGDTGLFPAMKEIGERLGPFDLTMIEVGAYGQAWPDWHLGPEQAVRAHQWVRGEVLLPVHWGLFALAYHGWTEPIERTLVAADEAKVEVVAPRPGESVEPAAPPAVTRWWPEVPWRVAREYPIRATNVE
jgi:L-ascorbate metabolism protein UlaG (beta-lactamase superfamily)